MHGILGVMQSRLPYPLYQQMDQSKEKHLSTLPESLDNSQNRQIVKYANQLNSIIKPDVLNFIYKIHILKITRLQKNSLKSASIVYFCKHGLISSHFLYVFLKAHRFSLIPLFVLIFGSISFPICPLSIPFSINFLFPFSLVFRGLSKSLSGTFWFMNVSSGFGTSFLINRL